MVGREVSRHPEWDLMYAAGLTVQEIADRCHAASPNTVREHVKSRERYQPGTQTKHEAALAVREQDWPSTAWRRRLTQAQAFLAYQGRLPGYGGDRVESSLDDWIGLQRNAYHRGELSTPKIVLMGTLEGWNISARQREWNERWRQHLTELQAYVEDTGRLPRYKRYVTEHEHALGVWLHKQHQGRAEGWLRGWRHQALDAALPGWRSMA